MKKKSMVLIGMVVGCCLMMAGAVWGEGNGTVNVNGLVWLKDAGCLGKMTWYQATDRAKTLKSGVCGLTDGSKAGQWRLPTIDELQIIYSSKSKFSNVQANGYWSGSTYGTSEAWYVYMLLGYVIKYGKSNFYFVWPVRDGQ